MKYKTVSTVLRALKHISECRGPIAKNSYFRWAQLLSTLMEFLQYLVASTIDPLINEDGDGKCYKTDSDEHGGNGVCVEN
jgi:hypothetical protein